MLKPLRRYSKKPRLKVFDHFEPGYKKDSGGDLLSHTAARAVPSAQISLTSVFGMGTGVTLSQSPPKNWLCYLSFSDVLCFNPPKLSYIM